MTGIEPRISGVGSNSSTNCVTTTVVACYFFNCVMTVNEVAV